MNGVLKWWLSKKKYQPVLAQEPVLLQRVLQGQEDIIFACNYASTKKT
jgi:hypothetical protein